jgi:hemolysin III
MNSDLTENRGSLPNYSEGEEIFHVCSHAVGVLLGIGMMITVLVCYQNTFQLISGVIFGLSMIILYSVSCTYHGLSAKGPELEDKKNFQVVDHCSITLLIIGTQAPFALCILESAKSGFGWAIYGAVCAIACPVIILNILDLNRFKAVTMIGYFLMGGCLLVGMDILIPALTWQGFALFMAGGAAYSIGTIFYKLGGSKKIKWMHSVFHVFCVIGSELHLFCICLYVFDL